MKSKATGPFQGFPASERMDVYSELNLSTQEQYKEAKCQ